jgi:hypothetical protein
MDGQWIKVWTKGGHIITGTVVDAGELETLRGALEHVGSHVPAPVAANAVIRIPQAGEPPVQIVLDRIEAWLIDPQTKTPT